MVDCGIETQQADIEQIQQVDDAKLMVEQGSLLNMGKRIIGYSRSSQF